jgi:hypothetical protein
MTSSRVFGSEDVDERSRLLLLTDDDDEATPTRTDDEEEDLATFATTPRATRGTARVVTIMMMVRSDGSREI